MSTRSEVQEFTYGVDSTAIVLRAIVPVRVCGSCHLEFLDHEAEDARHDAVCAHLGVLTPSEVKSIRVRYNASRARFAEISGIGDASIARWESGSLIQGQAHDRLLRLLSTPSNYSSLEQLHEQRRRQPKGQQISSGARRRTRVLKDPQSARDRGAGFRPSSCYPVRR